MSKLTRGKKFVDLVLSNKSSNIATSAQCESSCLAEILDNVQKSQNESTSKQSYSTCQMYTSPVASPSILTEDMTMPNQTNEPADEFITIEVQRTGTEHHSDDSLSHYSDSDKDPNFIVPETEEESSEEDINYNNNNSILVNNDRTTTETKKTRKRKRNEGQWKCNQRKTKRCAGKSYITKNHQVMPAKTLKPPCLPSCKKKCTTEISEEKRQQIFGNFYREDFDCNMKRLYVANRVKKVDVVRRRSRTGSRENKRSYSLHYTFIIDDREIPVCKTFFLSTLCISQSFVDVALTKRVEGGGVTSDRRGKHTPGNKLSDTVRDTVRKHIESFPAMESHYSRERTKRKYLGNDLCIKKMYSLYLDYCKQMNLSKENIAKDWLYYDIFNKEYNLSFKQPANDTCDTCDEFKVTIQQVTSSEKELAQIDYDRHLMESQRRYKIKSDDKLLSRQDETKKVIMIDLQKCLATPYLTNSLMFYLRKLWTLNLTIFDASRNETVCNMWDETVGGRGGCEIASCLFKWAKEKILKTDKIEELTIWSDNCGGQNRNYIMISFYFWLLKKCPTLKIINHKFLLKGHTHMEVDVQHSVIERAKKKINNTNRSIMIPWDWQQFIRSCSSPNNPIEVYNMEYEDFLDFKTLFTGNSAPLVIRKKNCNNDNILISEMVHIQVRATDIGDLFYKTDFSDADFQKAEFTRHTRRSNNWPENIPVCRTTAKRISSAKYKDLQSALKWVPTCFHNFYKNIPHGPEVEEYPEDDSN